MNNATTNQYDDATRWQAVANRDATLDGAFVYGVLSTKIYCRPSCPSRRPQQLERVQFFANGAAAGSAGFRACRRCTPDTPPAQLALVVRACQWLAESDAETLSLSHLGAALGVNPQHLQRVFTKHLGISPREFVETRRLANFKLLLQQGLGVTDALYEAGFGAASRLYEKTDGQLGMTPTIYRKGGAGRRIVYALAKCNLGWLLAAATERGLCAVTLGDTAESLAVNLRAEFPQAEIVLDETAMGLWLNALLRHLEGQEPHLDLPLDVRATAFQRRVWDELRRIPYGTTRSYSEIAAALDQPTAARAVARACATNPVALVTPCHRVVRGNGDLSGYRWGLARKQKLLAQEKSVCETAVAVTDTQ